MKMKNFMAIAIAATMLTLVGCGNKNDSSSVSDVPASSTEATTETAETTTTAVETTTVETTTEKVETTTAEATEPDESTGDSMAFADMVDAIDKAMSAHANDPADIADDMLELCRATIEDLKANGLPLGEYTGEVGEREGDLDENGEGYGEHKSGDMDTVSALVCKMPASTLSASDIEGITLESADSFRMIDKNNTDSNYYTVSLKFDIGDNSLMTHKALENIFSYFIENGYTNTEKSGFVTLEGALYAAQTAIDSPLDSVNCWVLIKNDKFEIGIIPDTQNGVCELGFTKL